MPAWFEVLPQAPCAVQATTTGAKAFYFPPAEDGSRGGTFFVNVDDPGAWGTFEIEAMAFHEGIPGHHLQLAIASRARRRAGVPQAPAQLGVRRGLGALHRAPRRRDGPLHRRRRPDGHARRPTRCAPAGWSSTPGCTHSGWSREQAVDYMLANSPLAGRRGAPGDRPLRRLRPGRRPSYMVGRLEIQRMRARPRSGRASRFDIKRVPRRRARLRERCRSACSTRWSSGACPEAAHRCRRVTRPSTISAPAVATTNS